MGMLTFSVLMHLQSPHYNSYFWDFFRQLYDRKKNKRITKNKESLKISTATAIILMKKLNIRPDSE